MRVLPRLLILCPFLLTLNSIAPAQTFSVIHTFSNTGDGAIPVAGLTVDQAGNLYGTTSQYDGPGTVFQMKLKNGAWIFSTLYQFAFGDGIMPQGRPVFGPGGALYGTNTEGGSGNCNFACGTVYSLRPAQTICRTSHCPWSATLLTSFNGQDGAYPYYVDPAFDTAGNLYGTSFWGGSCNQGAVFQLTRSTGGEWTAASIHDFDGLPDGSLPESGVTLDAAGHVYGTTAGGGESNYGTVYRLTPSGSGWTETILYSFHAGADGGIPVGGVVFDHAGNLYGTTMIEGSGNGGTVFKLSPSGGSWVFSTIYSFPSISYQPGPRDTLSIDSAGNLYGTSYGDGIYGYGNVFKLSPGSPQWTYTDLHDFTDGNDGGYPIGGVSMDGYSDLYGTASAGGQNSKGVVWEITP
jgi:uncharacterized repeat protein (TIGR03803 family)